MSKLIHSTLENICLPEKGSIISGPFGSNISSKYFVDSGIPVIRGNNLSLTYDKFYDDGFVFVTPEKAEELKCYAIRGDLIFTAAGTLGQVGIIPANSIYDTYVISNKQIRARLNSRKIDVLYAFYWFSSPWIQKKLKNNNKGSTVPLLTLAEVKSLPIVYPESLEEQHRIAECIDKFSMKIENNNAINDNLAQQAKLLYDYWFTQFDFPDENDKPYRSSGGQMVWNDMLKKKIPLGWEVKTLSELLKKNTQSFDYSSVQPTIDLSVMPSDSIALSQINSSENFLTNLYVMKKGDILFGSIRPYLHKAGIAPCDGAVAGTVYSYQTVKSNDYNFSLFTIVRDSFFDYAVNTSSGTKMPVVSSDSILSFKFAYSKEVAEKFNSIPIMEIITRNVQETQRLIKLRDFLLPLLMNGQATIAE